MTNPQLRWWYKYYNRKYFGGKLPKISVRFCNLPVNVLGWSTHIGEWVSIEITKEVKHWPRVSRHILMHEMVHVSLPRNAEHGKKFQEGMLRLAKAGAFKELW